MSGQDELVVMFSTPLIVTQVLDLRSAKVFMALVDIKLKVAPESSRALAIMVLPVGPVSSTWLVMSRLLGMLSVELGVAVFTDAEGAAAFSWMRVLCLLPQTLHLYSDLQSAALCPHLRQFLHRLNSLMQSFLWSTVLSAKL